MPCVTMVDVDIPPILSVLFKLNWNTLTFKQISYNQTVVNF